MLRRDFLKSSVALAAAVELGAGEAHGLVRAHNWGNYDFGSGPPVKDRLNQGPFPSVSTRRRHSYGRSGYDHYCIRGSRAELWQGLDHIHHGRQRDRRNQIGQYSPSHRGPGSISLGATAIHTAHLAGDPTATGTSRATRLREAHLRSCEKEQQAHWVSRSDERSGL